MKLHDFLGHYQINRNPFAEEDAQTDPIFRDYCIFSTYHPAWDKVFGDPANPATAIVFGEKGAGKTALRLQVEKHIAKYNLEHGERRCFVVAYDDFNPILDNFRERVGRRSRRPERILQHFHLWDHMDAILSLAVTDLVTKTVPAKMSETPPDGFDVPKDIRRRLDRHQKRDLLLLATCYDNTSAVPLTTRWSQLRRRIGGGSWLQWWPFALASVTTVAIVAALITFVVLDQTGNFSYEFWNGCFWPYRWGYLTLLLLSWMPWAWRLSERWWMAGGIARHIRVFPRHAVPVTRQLMRFTATEMSGQPLPNKDRTDDRYALLEKLQGILNSLGFTGIVVLVDRMDEPHLINGSTDAMKALLWPMLDNKFLKQEGVGIKFLLPVELTQFIDREDKEFYQRARLDKQNMIPSLHWTGAALYDVANARLAACSPPDASPKLSELFNAAVSEQRLFDALQSLRVPRHMFKFLYRVIMAHCNQHSSDSPSYKISPEMFEAELAVYRREQEHADRGLGA